MLNKETDGSLVSQLVGVFHGALVNYKEDADHKKYLAEMTAQVKLIGGEKIVNLLLHTKRKLLLGGPISHDEIAMLNGAESALQYAPDLQDLNERIGKETGEMVESVYGAEVDALMKEYSVDPKWRSGIISYAEARATMFLNFEGKERLTKIQVMEEVKKFMLQRLGHLKIRS